MVYLFPKKVVSPCVMLIRPNSTGLIMVPRSLSEASAWIC